MADEIEPIEAPERPDTDADDDSLEEEFEGQDGASVPGVPFAYDLTRDEIIRQEASIREVNARLGFLLAAALTFATFLVKETDPHLKLVGGLALSVVLVLLLIGYVPRTHVRSPNPKAVAKLAGERPGKIKEEALGSMLKAFDQNILVISHKTRFYSLALYIGGVFVVGWLLWGAYDGGHTLWENSHPIASSVGVSHTVPEPLRSRFPEMRALATPSHKYKGSL